MPRWCEVPSRAYGVGIDVSRTSVLSVESLVGAFPGRSSMGNVRRRMTGLTVAGGGVPFDQLGTVPEVRMRVAVIGQELVRQANHSTWMPPRRIRPSAISDAGNGIWTVTDTTKSPPRRHPDDHLRKHTRRAIPPRTPQRPDHRHHRRSRLGYGIFNTIRQFVEGNRPQGISVYPYYVTHLSPSRVAHGFVGKKSVRLR